MCDNPEPLARSFQNKDERETKIAFCHCSTRLSYQTFRSELELNQRPTGNNFMRLVILSIQIGRSTKSV